MNSNDLNDHTSHSSSSSSCSELSSSGCTQASAQHRHQMQGGINSLHQGHRQPSQAAQNNQPADNSIFNADVTSSSGQSNVSISTNTLQSNIVSNQVISSVDNRISQNPSSSFPTSRSCNAIVATPCSCNDTSCICPASVLSSSLTSLFILQKQLAKQSTQSQFAYPSKSNSIQSILPSSTRSSVDSSTPSVSLDHVSQVLHQPSSQLFSSSPSLVQSPCSTSISTNSCQFISSNLSHSYPAVTSSVATVVTTKSPVCDDVSLFAHRTQVKEAITTSSTINSITTSGVNVTAMSGQSNSSESCISSVNGGKNVPTVDSVITKNHSDSTRNAVHQSRPLSEREECIDARAIASCASVDCRHDDDESYASRENTAQSCEVPSVSNAHNITGKRLCCRSGGSRGTTDDHSSPDISTDTVRHSTVAGALASSSAPVEAAAASAAVMMVESDASPMKSGQSPTPSSSSSSGTCTGAVIPAVKASSTHNSCKSHSNTTTSFANAQAISSTSSTSDDSLEFCWQSRMPSTKARLTALLNKETLSDVYFLVGQAGKRVKFPAHKFVLSMASPVFDRMFNGNFTCDMNPVELPDCEPCAFLAFLTFLYTDEVIVDANTVMSTLYISKKYGVFELEKQCVEFLRRNLTPNNSIVLLSQARFFDQTDLAQNCLECIDKATIESLDSEGFTDIDRDTLAAILTRDSLEIPEVTLWKCVLSWAKAECIRQNLNSSDPLNIRLVLGPTLNLIRFPLMSVEEYAAEVAQTGVLVDKQIIEMFLYFTVNPKPHTAFSCETRGQNSARERVVQRFQKVESRWGYSGTSDRIRFWVNRRIFLLGFGLYGAIHGPSKYDVCMQLLLHNSEVVASNETFFTCDGSTKTFRVNFKQPVEISPNVSYTACVTMKGVDSYYGAQGKSTVSIEAENKTKVTFKFNYSSGCNNGTSVEDGQIPELYFHT